MNKSEKMYDCVVYLESEKRSREKKELESRMFSIEESTVNDAGNDSVKKRNIIYSQFQKYTGLRVTIVRRYI